MIDSGGEDGSDDSDWSDQFIFSEDSFYIAKRCPYKWVAGSGEGRVCIFLILVDCRKSLTLSKVDSVNIIPFGGCLFRNYP